MIWLVFVVLFLFLGFAVHKLKWHFLISGYNTMPKEQKKNVDVEKLGKAVGIYAYFMSVLFALMALAHMLEYSQLILPFIIIVIVATIVLIIKTQKYNHNLFDEKGKWKQGAGKHLKKPAIILTISLAAVAIIIYFANERAKIEATEEGLEIGGMYGDTYHWAEMEQVMLVDHLPDIAMRTNGSAIGSMLQGHFKFENGEKAKLFIDKSNPPFVRFIYEDKTIIFNLPLEQQTRTMYELIVEKTKQ
ncbi:DUF3784 domain-containing protein [Solibacillus silvestris]|uniref:DUF3784 domain-containing protein n=1 Tax=Solibacillus silvestris TaxID=76853 RepID=UPI003F8018CE